MKRWIFSCVLIPVAGLAAPRVGGELDYETSKTFYNECLRFDYCGTNGVLRIERGESHEKVLPVMVRFQPDVVLRDKEFYEMLRRFEVSMLAGMGCHHGDGREIGRWLLEFKKQGNQLALWNYASSVEYSLLRILDSGIDKISISEIDDILPAGLYAVKPKRSEDPCRGVAHKIFKNMIVIAWKLGEWKRNHGSYPAELQALGLDDKWLSGIGGSDIEYEMKDGIWQLFSPGARGGKNKCVFNEYVPVMDAPGVRFWPQSSCLWLSSDYSEKRLLLYEHGKLYDSASPCACKLENGGIYRQ